MKLGIDGRKIPEAKKRGCVGTIQHAYELGMSGVFFRTILDMSPTLDMAELTPIRECADSLGMYMETGLGMVNPYASPESPELRNIGDGDTVLGFRRMMEACAAIGCTELWSELCGYKTRFAGRWAYDRFRTDVTWPDQLAATTKFLKRLAPVARDLGIHINLETHEEVTSFELIRIIEEVGRDTVGIVFDTANILQRVEHPIWAARRVAPYVRQTHIKDAALVHDGRRIVYQHRACGQGVVDFKSLLTELARVNPTLNLSIENEYAREERAWAKQQPMFVELYDHDFLAAHPDLSVDEVVDYLGMVREFEVKVADGAVESISDHETRAFGVDEAVADVMLSAQHIRKICTDFELPLDPSPLAASGA